MQLTTMERASNLHKKRKADYIATELLHECEPVALGDFEDGSLGESPSLRSTHSFSERRRRPLKKQRLEQSNGTTIGKNIVEFRVSKKSCVLSIVEEMTNLIDHSKPTQKLPRTSRIQALPAGCLRGKWRAEWKIETEGMSNAHPSSKYRLCIRHTSTSGMESLPPALHDPNVGTASTRREKVKGNAPGGSYDGDIVVSSVFPLKKRVSELSRHTSKYDKGNKRQPEYISSISLVGCQGFSSARDTSASAMSSDILETINYHLSGKEYVDDEEDDTKENIAGKFPLMFPLGEKGDAKCLGITFPCALPLETKYHLRFAQDQSLANNPIVAVDVIFNEDISGGKEHPLNGRSENLLVRRPSLQSSSSEDDDFNDMGNQYFSPSSFGTVDPTDPVSMQRPKSLVRKFDEEASRSEEEAKKAASKSRKAPTNGKKKTQPSFQVNDVFRKKKKKKTKAKDKPFLNSKSLEQSKKATENRRVSLESRAVKGSRKHKAVPTRRVIPPTPPAKSRFLQAQSPDSFQSWEDDWRGSSVGSEGEEERTYPFHESRIVAVQKRTREKKAKQKTSRADAGLIVSEDERSSRKQNAKRSKKITKRVQKNGSPKSRSIQPSAIDADERSRRDTVITRSLESKPRHPPQTGKRRWLSAIALLFAIGGSRKEMVPHHLLTLSLTRQKMSSLPPPVRLTNKNPKSFSLESTIW
ncbi:MAG: hypothetical protein SGILL_005939 [Bacillariaceae sp.]